jgi:hypothetical protein
VNPCPFPYTQFQGQATGPRANVHSYNIYIDYELSHNFLHFFPYRPFGLTGCLPARYLPFEAMTDTSVHPNQWPIDPGHASTIQNDQQLAVGAGAVRDVTRVTQLDAVGHDGKQEATFGQLPGSRLPFQRTYNYRTGRARRCVSLDTIMKKYSKPAVRIQLHATNHC